MNISHKAFSCILCTIITIILGWLFLFPLRKLPFLGKYSIILGKNPLTHVMMIITVFLYLYIYIIKPEIAKRSTLKSLSKIKDLFIYIVAALFISGATINLLPSKVLIDLLGREAGVIAVLAGVAFGSILPACPFISYPIIAGFYAAGVGFPGVMGMLFGSGLCYPCYITCDLTFFDHRILILRVLLTFASALVAGFLLYLAGIITGV